MDIRPDKIDRPDKTDRPDSSILKIKNKEDVEYLSFNELEKVSCINHLFTTRHGGVSEGIFSAMNLSFGRGDDPNAVHENFRRIAKVLDTKVENMVCSSQTHTTNIRKVSKDDGGKGILRKMDYENVDGLITREKGLVLATFYADCVPLYIVDPVKEAIGLAHSGWRGTVGRIGREVVKQMQEEFGSCPEDLQVAIGPSICRDCYEISEDVAMHFWNEFSEHRDIMKKTGIDKYHLDLWKTNRYVFEDAGVPAEHIYVTDICTCCNSEYLFSHRASYGKRGNLGAFLVLRNS